jgi:DNA-binding beta-propeller fold protein YncE
MVHSGRCLDVEGASQADGANIIQWTCHGGGNQSVFFRLLTPTTDTYTLEFQHSGKCLSAAGGSQTPGTNLVQSTCTGVASQQFVLTPVGTSYRLDTVNNTAVVEVAGASVDNLGSAQLGSPGSASHQTFTLQSTVPQAPPPSPSPGPTAATNGSWGPVIDWPHIAVSMANLPDGRVLTWSGSERETWPSPERTYTATWDPITNAFNDIFIVGHNMFCANQVMMADGRVFVNGGRNGVNSPYVSVFDYRDNSWTPFENMASGGRWYPTTVALADGDVYTAMGTASMQRTPERWDPRDGWQLQPNADYGTMVLNPYPDNQYRERRWWPLLNLAPNGKLFHSGPTPQMHWINTQGLGASDPVGPLMNSFYHKHGVTVMYEEGRILTAGGWTTGTNQTSTNQSFTIDLNGPAPVVQNTAAMNFSRKFHMAVMLPTGEVMVVGGNTSGRKFSDDGAVLDIEFWNPQTGTWRVGPPMSIPRGYHSTAILLLDGRVLSAGGGYCSGNAFCNGSSHRDGQVYSPAYLFDANGNPASRPALTSAPGVILPGVDFTVDADRAIARFTAVKMSSTTHAMNTDLRFLEFAFRSSGGNRYVIEPHRNPNVLTPGYWMLFGLDANGVPSVGISVRVETTESRLENLAVDGVATQSTTAPGTPPPFPENAIDGDMSGTLASGSMARTDVVAEPWWQVDLRNSATIESIRLWGPTNCCQSELADFYVFVSSQPFASTTLADTLADPAVYAFPVTGSVDRLLDLPIDRVGRYVRVQRSGTGRLALDEVQVFGQDNLALAGSATQSSQFGTVEQFGPANAINGNRSGNSSSNSITHTAAESEAWWQLDLSLVADIEDVVLWNRTDCCSSRLSNFEVFVSEAPFNSTSLAATRNQAGVHAFPVTSLSDDSLRLPIDRRGRYIRVQLSGTESLSLAEVEVHGTPASGGLEVQPLDTPPHLVGQSVTFAASAVGAPPLEYAWDYGDGTSVAFGAPSSVSHTYQTPGRYVVSLQVRDGSGASETVFSTQIIHRALTAAAPTASGTILVQPYGMLNRVWNVNPDNDSVSVIEGDAVVAEIPVGDGPWSIAAAPLLNEVWVVNKHDATIAVIDSVLLSISRIIELDAGSQPHGIAFAPESNTAYVATEATGEILRIEAVSGTVDRRHVAGGRMRHVSVDATGTEVYASRFISPVLPGEDGANPVVDDGLRLYGGEVVVLNANLVPQTTVVLQHSDRAASEHSGPGIPNYLGPAVISPDGAMAWVPSKQDNILAGGLRGGVGITFEHTVRAVSSMIDLGLLQEDFGFRIDHDNASVANHAAFGPYGAYMFTALEGNRQIAVSDTFAGVELLRFDVGRAPQGLAMGDDGRTLYVHNFLDRTVSAFDVSDVVDRHERTVVELWTRSTVGTEALATNVLTGKQLFYDARDDRLALDDYMACASCHNDGGQDGRVWDFTSLGEGLRNTIALRGRGGADHGPLHWSANFDEIHDFENQIRGFAGGTGLMTDPDFAATQPLLGPSKAGLSADLDALASYLGSLTGFARSPARQATLSAEANAGRQLFETSGCSGCHFGEALTDSGTGPLHDVGTMTAASGARQGAPLPGIDTPTLRDVWFTAPYLHDGSAPSLESAVAAHLGVSLTSSQLNDVAAYLRELEPMTMGTVTTDERVRTIPLSVFDAPIVVMGPPSRNGGDPSTMRVMNHTVAGFDYFLDEWDYKDGPHTNESVGYLVMDGELRELGGLAAEANVAVVDHDWLSVTFERPFAQPPAIVCQVATMAGPEAVTTRLRNITTTGFQIQLEEEEASDGVHAPELVHWIAVEPGTGSVLGRPLEAGRVSNFRHRWKTLSFNRSYVDPVLLANIQTHNGGDTAAVRYRNLTSTSVQLRVEEEKSRDNETNHVDEDMGYIVIGR